MPEQFDSCRASRQQCAQSASRRRRRAVVAVARGGEDECERCGERDAYRHADPDLIERHSHGDADSDADSDSDSPVGPPRATPSAARSCAAHPVPPRLARRSSGAPHATYGRACAPPPHDGDPCLDRDGGSGPIARRRRHPCRAEHRPSHAGCGDHASSRPANGARESRIDASCSASIPTLAMICSGTASARSRSAAPSSVRPIASRRSSSVRRCLRTYP